MPTDTFPRVETDHQQTWSSARSINNRISWALLNNTLGPKTRLRLRTTSATLRVDESLAVDVMETTLRVSEAREFHPKSGLLKLLVVSERLSYFVPAFAATTQWDDILQETVIAWASAIVPMLSDAIQVMTEPPAVALQPVKGLTDAEFAAAVRLAMKAPQPNWVEPTDEDLAETERSTNRDLAARWDGTDTFERRFGGR